MDWVLTQQMAGQRRAQQQMVIIASGTGNPHNVGVG